MNITKKNALIVAYNDLNKSGVPNVIYQTIKALSDEYNFDVIVFGDNDYYYKKLIEEQITNVNIFKFIEEEPNNKIKHIFWNLYARPKKHYRDMMLFLSDKKYELVHSFKEYDSWPFLKACKKRGIKNRIIHSTVIHDKSNNLLQHLFSKRYRRLSLKYSTMLIGVSELCCKKAFPKKEYTVIYNSFDEKTFNSNIQNTLDNNKLVLTHLATFNSNKNQLFSLAVVRELKKHIHNVKLNLIGRETEAGYLTKITQFINENELNYVVEIIDGNSNLSSHFANTTFTLLPSKKEGAGITAIEAQACGIEVFASSNVSKEMDAGGITFLDLEAGPAYWAKVIADEFNKNKNTRRKYDMSRFSYLSFCKSIRQIYNQQK